MDIGRTLPADVSRELTAANALAQALLEAPAEGIVQLDADRKIVRFNASAQRILGYAQSSVIGSAFEDMLHSSNRNDVFSVPPGGDALVTGLTLRDSRGGAVPVRARCIAISHDETDGWAVAFQTKQRAQEIEQLKSEIVSTVSHELKTPLSTIKAYAATLRQNPALYDSHRDEFLTVVEQQADRLSRLVEDMLLVARVETAQMLRKRELIDLNGLVDSALSELRLDPVLHPVNRNFASVQVSGDPDRLRDALRNLLENAAKYSPAGGEIDIDASQKESRTTIVIRDRGLGISEDHLPFIFDRFYRAEEEGAEHAGGSGLGLYIVQALVRAHGGTIDVKSKRGAGTAFTLTLPVRR